MSSSAQSNPHFGYTDPSDIGRMAEKELAEDAQWKIFQKKTFTRWANQHLKLVNISVSDIEVDFCDGIRLAALVECLSGQRFKQMNKNPTFRTQKLENVTQVLKFLEDKEGLRLVSIDSSHIVDSNLKLILGLMWALILHYSISVPMFNGDETKSEINADSTQGPRQLMNWVREKLPGVKNFTTDWKNGVAIGALVDASAPGLCPDWPDWNSKESLRNATEAMSLAEEWLSVVQLIKPHELIDPNLDEFCLMTYLSQFPKAQLKEGAPLRPRTNPDKVKAYGPGLQNDVNHTSVKTQFFVDTTDAGYGDVDVLLVTSSGKEVQYEVVQTGSAKLREYTYIPQTKEEHIVTIKFGGQHVPGSPFTVSIAQPLCDPSRVTVSGPGVRDQTELDCLGRQTYFNVHTKRAGEGVLECEIIGPNGRYVPTHVSCLNQDGTYLIEYTPNQSGLHEVIVKYDGKLIPNFPLRVDIKSRVDSEAIYATGRGVQSRGIRAQDHVNFYVHTEQVGDNLPISVTLIDSNGKMNEIKICKVDNYLWKCSYIPQHSSTYALNVKYANEHIEHSPFTINVGPKSAPSVIAFGPGLDTGVVNCACMFNVVCTKEISGLGFLIEGPSEARVQCIDHGDDSALVTYTVSKPGEYAVHITCNDEDIPGSPFMPMIYSSVEDVHPEKLQMCVLDNEDLSQWFVDRPISFKVVGLYDAVTPQQMHSLNDSNLDSVLITDCYDESGNRIPLGRHLNSDGTATFTCHPKVVGTYTVFATANGIPLTGCPLRFKLIPELKLQNVKLWGPGLEATVFKQPTHFFVDPSNAFDEQHLPTFIKSHPVSVTITDNYGHSLPVHLSVQPNRTIRVDYESNTTAAELTIDPMLGKLPILKSPISLPIQSGIDTTKVEAFNLETSGSTKFGQLHNGGTHCDDSACATEPNHYDLKVRQSSDINLLNDPHSDQLNGTVQIQPKSVIQLSNGNADPKLHQRHPPESDYDHLCHSDSEQSTFMSNSYSTTSSKIRPLSAPITDNCQKDKYSPYVRRYLPRPIITNEEKNEIINKSKWPQPMIEQTAYNITAYGVGLERALTCGISEFLINSQHVPPAPISVTIAGPGEADINCSDNGDGTCTVTYHPPLPGRYTINVVYNDESHIFGSPFFVQAYPKDKPNLNVDDVMCCGCGLDEKDVYCGAYMKFKVDASRIDSVSKGLVTAFLKGPNNERLGCHVVPNGDGTYTCNYTPIVEGEHQLMIEYEGLSIPGSPFTLHVVDDYDVTRIRAYGPGLENSSHLISGKATNFTVDLTGAGKGNLGLAVEGPSETPMKCVENGDGTCTIHYTPTSAGAYVIYVRFKDINIPGSPFSVSVKQDTDPKRVHCYGPGLESDSLRAGWPAYFTVDTSNAGDGQLKVLYTKKPNAKLELASIQSLGPGLCASKEKLQSENYYKVSYTPELEGDCKIEVTYDDIHVPGSPFTVNIRKACEPELVRLLGAGIEGPVLASLPATFTVDAREAGIGDLSLAVIDPKGQSVPVRVLSLATDNESTVTNGAVHSVNSLASGDVSDNALLSCTFEPYLEGPHTVHVMFAGVEVGTGPITVRSIPTGRAELCTIKTPIKQTIAVCKENVIIVDTSLGEKGRLTCQVVQQPHGQPVSSATLLPVEIEDNKDGTISVYYKPTQESTLRAELHFGGRLIPNGEFVQKALPADEITDEMIDFRPVVFQLPVPQNKENIHATVIRPSGVKDEVDVTINDDDTMTATYHPVETGVHEMHINVHSQIQSDSSECDTLIMSLIGSPYKFFVDNVSTGQLTAYGRGLSHGMTNQLAEFTIVTKDAGVGGLTLSVEGPSKAKINCKDNEDGTCSVNYLPLAPGLYKVSVKFADQHISGSPFEAKITGDLVRRSHVSMGTSNDIALAALEEDITTLTALVRSPSGREEPCILKSLPNNRLGISFTPKEVGEHLVSVFQTGQHIPNSPFCVCVTEKEIGDPHRVRLSGPGLVSAISNKPNQFTVDTRDAGYAGLSLSIEGPSNADIECVDNNDGTCRVIYTPTKPGHYIINVKYADQHVPDSPLYINVGGEPTAKMTERITRCREASKVTHIGSRCELSLRLANTNAKDLSATVTAPSGETTKCEVVTIDSEHYSIKFVPLEMGEHLVDVKCRGITVSGSPFHFTVGPISDGGAPKVRTTGDGLQEGLTNVDNKFVIYTREAGAGTLSISIEGPSQAEIDCDEQRDGSSLVTYRVSHPGIYLCSLRFNDEHIPCSPFHIQIFDSAHTESVASYNFLSSFATPTDIEANNILEDHSFRVGRSISFTVHHTEQTGHILKAKVITPSGKEEDAIVELIDDDQFTIRFIPNEGGPHYIHAYSVPIEYANTNNDWIVGPNSPFTPIHGSPFRLLVGQHVTDTGMVYATGDGLCKAKVGVITSFLVNTTNAGCGILNITVDGPSKAIVTSHEHEDGYEFCYTPTAPGIYEIAIKYGSSHIEGSPFKVDVTGSAESVKTEYGRSHITLDTANKAVHNINYSTGKQNEIFNGSSAQYVSCSGPGLERAYRERDNCFMVDASRAGDNVLFVGISGPQQTSEEVHIKHLPNNRYNVTYRVFERGNYRVIVIYGNQPVPGSPFEINVV